MSYILDALRKAEAERERGHVPGVHAQPLFPASAGPGGTARRPPAWMVPAVVAVVVAAAIGVWFGVSRSGGPASAPASPVATAPTVVPAPAPAPPPVAYVPPPAAPAPLNEPPARSLDSIVAALPKPAPAPAAPSPANLPASSFPADGATLPNPVPAVPTLPNTPPAAATPSDTRIYALNELPDEIRRQLPTLAIGGSMYSPTPANRLVIMNGVVLHEGERVNPDLVLQQIQVKAAVLVFKGYRYRITY